MSDMRVQDNIKTNILTDPVYAEAIDRCVQRLSSADPESEGKNSFGNAVIACHQDLQAATEAYQVQHPEPVRIEDVHDLAMTADIGFYDVSGQLMDEITGAIERRGEITPTFEQKFRAYATTYALADYARSEVCSGIMPADVSRVYEQMNPGSSPNCPQLSTRMQDIDRIAKSKDPIISTGGVNLKKLLHNYGRLTVGLGYSFQPVYPRATSSIGVQAGFTIPVASLPLLIGAETSLGLYLTADASFMPQGELKTTGLEFKPVKLLVGYYGAGFAAYLTGGAWPTYYHLFQQGQVSLPFNENEFQNITSEAGVVVDKDIKKVKITGEVGMRNDPYGLGGYMNFGVGF